MRRCARLVLHQVQLVRRRRSFDHTGRWPQCTPASATALRQPPSRYRLFLGLLEPRDRYTSKACPLYQPNLANAAHQTARFGSTMLGPTPGHCRLCDILTSNSSKVCQLQGGVGQRHAWTPVVKRLGSCPDYGYGCTISDTVVRSQQSETGRIPVRRCTHKFNDPC